MDKRKINILYGIITILVLANIYQLFSNLKNQRTINILEEKISHAVFSSSRTTPLYVNSEINEISNQELSLITLFGDVGCPECMQREINHLNELNKNFSKYIQVFYSGFTPEKMEIMGAEFEFQELSPSKATRFLSEEFLFKNPLILLVDSNFRVQAILESEVSNPSKSENFFSRVESLFETVHNSQNSLSRTSKP